MLTVLLAFTAVAVISVNVFRVRRGHRGFIVLYLAAALAAAVTTVLHVHDGRWIDLIFSGGVLLTAVYAAGMTHALRRASVNPTVVDMLLIDPDNPTTTTTRGEDRPMTDIVTEPTLPGMPETPEPEPLWAVHNRGADEIIAQASRRDAELLKGLLDELDAKNADKPEYPTCAAQIIPWPGTRAEHAAELRREGE
jgi:hypothetical protein